MIRPLCRKDQTPMKEGQALRNQLYVHADFPGDYFGTDITKAKRGQTLSASGPAVLIKCWKCPKCGHSIAR